MESLHEMGHPDYSDTIFPYKVKCSDSTSKLKQLVSFTKLLNTNDSMFK